MVWDEIEDNTGLPLHAKSFVMSTIAKIWRKWKSYVKKKYFTPYKDNEVFPKTPPDDARIQVDQWWEMVEYWKNPKVQGIAEQNTLNILNKECLHRTGRTPFSILEEELLANGVSDLSQLDLWMESRTRGKGIGDDPVISDLHSQLSRELSKKPESERTKEYKDGLFHTAFGKEKYGHILCTGRENTVNKSRAKAKSTDGGLLSKDQEELQKLRDEFGKQQDDMKEMKEECI